MQSRRPRVLLVDDEPAARLGARRALGDQRYEIAECADGASALEELARAPADLVLLDLRMPGMDGTTALERILDLALAPPVVVVTADATLRTAIDAVKAGATDYLTKPYEIDELRHVAERAIESARLAGENRRLRARVRRLEGTGGLLGESPEMRALLDAIERVAPTSATVLVTGETGSGKERVARLVHERSAFAPGPFVAVNCAAIPESLVESELFGHRRGAFTGADRDRAGKFEEAHGGTLLLDEVGDMPLLAQAKLLRVLEDGVVEPLGGGKTVRVSVRVVAATHRDLRRLVAEGRFREDLSYRLRVVEIAVPPLRDRGTDVLLLARRFLADTGRGPCELDRETERALLAHRWPGNVRELRNAVERAAIFCRDGCVRIEDLPADIRGSLEASAPVRAKGAERRSPMPGDTGDLLAEVPTPPGEDLASAKAKLVARYERSRIEEALAASGGSVSAAARSLGMHRQSLQAKIRDLGISAESFRA